MENASSGFPDLLGQPSKAQSGGWVFQVLWYLQIFVILIGLCFWKLPHCFPEQLYCFTSPPVWCMSYSVSPWPDLNSILILFPVCILFKASWGLSWGPHPSHCDVHWHSRETTGLSFHGIFSPSISISPLSSSLVKCLFCIFGLFCFIRAPPPPQDNTAAAVWGRLFPWSLYPLQRVFHRASVFNFDNFWILCFSFWIMLLTSS